MNTYVPSEEVLALYIQASARLQSFERLAASALTGATAPAQARKEARSGIEDAAKSIRAFYDSFSFGADVSRDTLGIGTEADRKQKLFLGDFTARLQAQAAALEKRLDQASLLAAKSLNDLELSEQESRIKSSVGDGTPDFHQAMDRSLAAFEFFRNLSNRLPQEAVKARTAKVAALDKELVSIKLRSFIDQSAPLNPKNPELLFKAKLKFERLEQEGAPRSVLAERPAGTVGVSRTETGIELGYEEGGVALRFCFRRGTPGRYEGGVYGFVESGGERAEFSLNDPLSKDPKVAASADVGTPFAQFLARFDLRKLYESGEAIFSALEEEARLKPVKAAEKLSRALDDIL